MVSQHWLLMQSWVCFVQLFCIGWVVPCWHPGEIVSLALWCRQGQVPLLPEGVLHQAVMASSVCCASVHCSASSDVGKCMYVRQLTLTVIVLQVWAPVAVHVPADVTLFSL